MPRPWVAAYRFASADGPTSTSMSTVTGRRVPTRYHEVPAGFRYTTPRSVPTTMPPLASTLMLFAGTSGKSPPAVLSRLGQVAPRLAGFKTGPTPPPRPPGEPAVEPCPARVILHPS